MIDLTKGAVPVAFAFGLLSLVGGACIKIGMTLGDYSKTQSDVLKLAHEVRDLQKALISWRPEDRWSRSDQVLFCWEAERANPNWRCPALKPASRVELERAPPSL